MHRPIRDLVSESQRGDSAFLDSSTAVPGLETDEYDRGEDHPRRSLAKLGVSDARQMARCDNMLATHHGQLYYNAKGFGAARIVGRCELCVFGEENGFFG